MASALEANTTSGLDRQSFDTAVFGIDSDFDRMIR